MEYPSTEIRTQAEHESTETWSDLSNQIQFIDEDIMAWTNALHMRNTLIALEIDNQAYQFSLLPNAPVVSDLVDKPDIIADISTAKSKFQIALQDISSIEFLRIPKHNQPPSDVMCAIFEFHLDAFLTMIESHSGSLIKIDAIKMEPDCPSKCDYELFFQLVHTTTSIKTLGSFLLDRVSLAWLSQAFCDKLAPITVPGYWNVPVRVEFMSGNARSLPLSEIKSLGIGDVILDNIPTNDQIGSLVIAKVQGRPMWHCRAAIDSLTVVDRVETGMNDKKMKIDPTQLTKTDLESLEIDLEFEIGSLKMPLAELKSVQEGYVFELKQKAFKYITVHANGQPIARGELVNTGQRLGVRVIELLLAKS